MIANAYELYYVNLLKLQFNYESANDNKSNALCIGEFD